MNQIDEMEQREARSREDELILLLEEIEVEQFLFDADTRARVRAVLDEFTDEEFARFLSVYRQRFLSIH